VLLHTSGTALLTSAPLNRRTKDQHHISPHSVAIYLSESFLCPLNCIETISNHSSVRFQFTTNLTSTSTSSHPQYGQLNRLHRHSKCPGPVLLRSRHKRSLYPLRSSNTRRRCQIPFPRRRHARSRRRDLNHIKAVSHSTTKISLPASIKKKETNTVRSANPS
jgi:hypothetical protein